MNKGYSGSEKRKSRRLRANFTLIYQVNKSPTVVMNVGYGSEIEGLMLDLSEGGMSMLTNYDIPKSTVLSIKFTLINRALEGDSRIIKINMLGIVCNNALSENEEHRLGIQFSDISEKDRKAIADFIKLSPFK